MFKIESINFITDLTYMYMKKLFLTKIILLNLHVNLFEFEHCVILTYCQCGYLTDNIIIHAMMIKTQEAIGPYDSSLQQFIIIYNTCISLQ